MSNPEQKHELYLKQKALLDMFLEKHAISKKQYDKSFHDLTEKMGEEEYARTHFQKIEEDRTNK